MSNKRRKRRNRAKKKVNTGNPKPEASRGLDVDLDRILCTTAKKYGLEKLMLKAVCMVESAMQVTAYRFEQGFWDRYLKDNAKWQDQDPEAVSASYGLMQIMYVVAVENGFSGTPEELYNPVYNIELGAKILRNTINWMVKQNKDVRFQLWPVRAALAAYNGGRGGNPDENGALRNQSYVDKVFTAWAKLREEDEECD